MFTLLYFSSNKNTKIIFFFQIKIAHKILSEAPLKKVPHQGRQISSPCRPDCNRDVGKYQGRQVHAEDEGSLLCVSINFIFFNL